MEGIGKMCVFQRKTGHILKTVIDRTKVTIKFTKKWHTRFHMR